MNVQLTTLNRILIIGGLFLVIAVLGFFFVYQPKTNQINLTRAEIASLQQQYDELSRVAAQKPIYISLINQIKQRLTGVEITADPRTYVPSYLKQVEDLAKRDGLIVTSVSPSATAAPSPGPSATPAPSGLSHPAAVLNAPVIGQPLQQANRALGARAANVAAENGVIGAVGTSGPARPGATPGPGQPGQAAAGAGQLPAGVQPGSARAAAIVYLNQSFTQVPFAMEFNGKYEQFERFLRDLNKFPKLLGVGDVTIDVVGKAEVGVAPQLKISLPVTAYRLSPTGAAQGAGPGAAPPGAGGQ